MEDIKETIISNYPDIVPYECSKKIIKQMERNICKIKIGQEQGTRFFCKIPFPDKNNKYINLPVFITNNHILNENIINSNNIVIELDIKEEKEIKKINLNNRMKYTNKEYDSTIIELKEEDNIKNYIELDEKILNGINNDFFGKDYLDKTSYIIQYPKGNLSVSYGVIENVIENKAYEFLHKCSTERGSSGSPILNIDNNKIIGIHQGAYRNKFNKGVFLNYPIKEFIKKYHKEIVDINSSELSSLSSSSYKSLAILNIGNKYNSEVLKNLIKFLCFKRDILSKNNSSNIFEGYIVKSEIINILKQWYNIKEIINFLNYYNKLNEINYQNFDLYYPEINDYLNIHQSNYMKSIKQIEVQNKILSLEKISVFYSKYINNNNINLKYIDNFEIIDKEFADLLIKASNNHIDLLPIDYIINENKYILAIKLKINYIYEIASKDSNHNLTVENVIELNKNNTKHEFNNNIFKIIFQYGVKKLINNHKIKIDDNITAKICSIDELNFIHDSSQSSNSSVFSPVQEKYKNEWLITFITTNQYKIEILIDPNKTMRELIKIFFDKIKRGDLFGDENILFFYAAKIFSHYSDDLIIDIIGNNDTMTILVEVLDDKIKL